MLKPETWTKTILRNNIDKCLEYSLGYKFDKADRGQENREITNTFEWLKPYESDWIILQKQNDEEKRKNDSQKKKKKLVIQ